MLWLAESRQLLKMSSKTMVLASQMTNLQPYDDVLLDQPDNRYLMVQTYWHSPSHMNLKWRMHEEGTRPYPHKGHLPDKVIQGLQRSRSPSKLRSPSHNRWIQNPAELASSKATNCQTRCWVTSFKRRHGHKLQRQSVQQVCIWWHRVCTDLSKKHNPWRRHEYTGVQTLKTPMALREVHQYSPCKGEG